MKKRKKLAIIFLLAISIFIVAFIFFFFLSSQTILRYLVSKGAENLERRYLIKVFIDDVRLQGLSVTIKGGFNIDNSMYSFQGLRYSLLTQKFAMYKFKCITENRIFGEIERVTGSVEILPLLKYTLVIKDLEIFSPEVYLQADDSGKLIFPRFEFKRRKAQSNGKRPRFKAQAADSKIINGFLKFPDFTGIKIANLDAGFSVKLQGKRREFNFDMDKGILNYGLKSFHLSKWTTKGKIEGKKITLKEFELKTRFADIKLHGDYDFSRHRPRLDLLVETEISLSQMGKELLLKDNLNGYAKIYTKIKGLKNEPDITGWVKIEDGYFRNVKISNMDIPYQFIKRKEVDNNEDYMFRITRGSLNLSEINKSWFLKFPDLNVELTVQNYFKATTGFIKLNEPEYRFKSLKTSNDSVYTEINSKGNKIELIGGRILRNNALSEFSGDIYLDKGLRYNISYDLKTDPKDPLQITENISLRGNFDIKGKVQGENATFTTGGSVSGDNITILDEEIKRCSFNYEINRNTMEFNNIKADLYNGAIQGNVSIALGFEPEYSGALYCNNVELNCISYLLIARYKPSGELSGYITFSTKDLDPSRSKFRMDVQIIDREDDNKGKPPPINLRSRINYDNGRIDVDQFDLAIAGINAEIHGSLDINDKMDLEYWVYSEDLSRLGASLKAPLSSGFLSILGSASGSWTLPSTFMRINLQDTKYNKVRLENFSGTIKGEGGGYRLRDSEIRIAGYEGELSGDISFPLKNNQIDYEALSIKGDIKTKSLRADGCPLDDLTLSYLYSGQDLKCRLYSEDERIDGIFSLDRRENSFSSEMKITEFDILKYLKTFTKSEKLDKLDNIPITINASISGRLGMPASTRGQLSLEKIVFKAPAVNLTNKYPIKATISGYDLDVSNFELFSDHSRFAGKINLKNAERWSVILAGKIDLSEVTKTGFFDQTFGGIMTLDVNLAGSFKEPLINGKFRLAEGSYLLQGMEQSITNVKGEVSIKNNNINIEKMEGLLGDGRIKIKGEINLKERLYDLNFDLINANFNYPEGLTSIISGTLNLKGTDESALLTGEIHPNYMKYTRQIRWQEWLLFFRKHREKVFDESQKKFPITYAIKIEAPDNIWLDSNFANLETDLNLMFQGTRDNPSLLGRINLLRGYISLEDLGLEYTKFEISEGVIDFINPAEINPLCDVRCETNIDDTSINLYLTGLADNLNLRFESEPPMDDYDLLYLLRTGKTSGSTAEMGEINLDSAADLLIVGKMRDAIVKQSEKALPVDEIEIEPIISGSERTGGVRITTTKVIDKLKVTYSVLIGTTEEEKVLVEYKLNDILYLTGEKTEEGGLGGGVKLRLSF